MINVQTILTPKQREGFKLLCMPTPVTSLYGGGRSGKTFDIAAWQFIIAMVFPSRHLILRKNLSTLISSMWYDTLPKVLDILEVPPSSFRFRGDRHFIRFINGSEIWLYGLDKNRRADKILGNEYASIWINEASEFDDAIIPQLRTRLAQNVGIKNKLILDFNPPVTSHWTYDLIMESLLNGEPVNLNYLLMNPEDNITNLPDDYIEMLETLPERQKKRFLYGIFVSPDESIFRENMLRPVSVLPEYWTKIAIGVDPATTEKINSDETGIFILGKYLADNFMLEDQTMKSSPELWGFRIVDCALRYQKIAKDVVVVAEVNQGGDMVGSVIKTAAANTCDNCHAHRHRNENNRLEIKGGDIACPHSWGVKINYRAVHTKVSKAFRAEDFSAQLAIDSWFINDNFNFKPFKKEFLGYVEMLENKKSPNRVDAVIIANCELNKEKKMLIYHTA